MKNLPFDSILIGFLITTGALILIGWWRATANAPTIKDDDDDNTN